MFCRVRVAAKGISYGDSKVVLYCIVSSRSVPTLSSLRWWRLWLLASLLGWQETLVFSILPMQSWAGKENCAVGYYSTSEDHGIRRCSSSWDSGLPGQRVRLRRWLRIVWKISAATWGTLFVTRALAMHSHIFILTALSAAVTLLETKRDQWLSMVVVNGKEKAFAIVAEKKPRQQFFSRVTKETMFPSWRPLLTFGTWHALGTIWLIFCEFVALSFVLCWFLSRQWGKSFFFFFF